MIDDEIGGWHPRRDGHEFDQALLSLGFFRQEYWSGVPLPSPTHESEK